MSIMKVGRTTHEQAKSKLREGERMLTEGQDLATVIQHLGISESTWDRWKNTYGETEPSLDEVGGDVATIVISTDRMDSAPDAGPLDRGDGMLHAPNRNLACRRPALRIM